MYMPLRWMWIVFLSLAAAAGGQNATQPAEQELALPDEPRTQQIKQWLGNLADPQATVRAKAMEMLMGLRQTELPVLRAAIEDAKPLELGQAAMLKEIVTQAYLASQPYEKSDHGFLGIVMVRTANEVPTMKVVVESRLPGFPGFRWLRDGDAILNIEERPLPQPMGTVAFTDVVSNLRPGTLIHLKVLRQGKVTRVAVRLEARPAQKADEDGQDYQIRVEEMMIRRGLEAEKYWKENFAPLVNAGTRNQ